MIEVVSGRIGGGKTCMCVVRMLEYCAKGGAVYTNIRLRGAVESKSESGKTVLTLKRDAPFCLLLKKRYGWTYQEGQYNFIEADVMDDGFQSVVPPGTSEAHVLVVIDEVNEWFDSLDRSSLQTNNAYRKTFRFLRQSRKVYIDVIFILQDFQTLNSRVRGLVGFVWVCRDMQYFKVAGLRIGWLLKHYFVWQLIDGQSRQLVETRWIAKDRAVFGLYDTTEIFGDGLGIAEQRKVDFREKKKEDGEMTKVERLALFGSVGLSAVCCVSTFFKGGGKMGFDVQSVVDKLRPSVVYVTNDVSSAASDGVDLSLQPRRSCHWASIRYCLAQGLEWAWVDGRLFKRGFHTPYGVVVDMCRDYVKCISASGEYWIFQSADSVPIQPAYLNGEGSLNGDSMRVIRNGKKDSVR